MSSLKEEFTRDHRKLTRGYLAIARALEKNELEKAKALADELDQVAGPHIEFEEEFLYPHVAEKRGDPFAARLYDEHSEILEAIRELRQCTEMSIENQKLLSDGMQVGLQHAATCGTLLSHLSVLPGPVQTQLLEEYLRLKKTGKRWTQLNDSPNQLGNSRRARRNA